MTTYDDIWECFIENCGVDMATLPQTDDGKYSLIRNGIRHYNTWVDFETPIKCDNNLEIINSDIEIDDNRILIMAYCMKYSFLENELVEFEQVWQPLTKEFGQKNYKDQIESRERRLKDTEQKALQHISNIRPYLFLD